MSDALLFLPVHHALTRLLFLGQMNGDYSMDLFRLICCIYAFVSLNTAVYWSSHLAQSRAIHSLLALWLGVMGQILSWCQMAPAH